MTHSSKISIRKRPHWSGPNRPVRDLVSFLESGLPVLIDPLHDGNELDVIRLELIPEEPVDLQGMVGILSVDRAEDVELHLVFLEQPGSPHDPVKGSMASLVFPVKVVKLFGTIQAEADQEFVLVEKLAPLVVEEDAVGLEGVLDLGAGLLIFFLKLHGSPEEIETHESRLASLPGHGDLRNLVGFEKLPDISLVHLIGHPEIASRIELLLLQEEAVVAVQIAGRTRWLGHDVKSLWNIR